MRMMKGRRKRRWICEGAAPLRLGRRNARDGGEEEEERNRRQGRDWLNIYIERREGHVCFKGNKDDFGYLKPKLAIVYSF